MPPELLPPKSSTVLTTEPQLRLRHLPLAMAWLGGIVAFAAVLITVAVLAEAIAAVVAIAAIASLLLIFFPILFWKVYRMRQAESSADKPASSVCVFPTHISSARDITSE